MCLFVRNDIVQPFSNARQWPSGAVESGRRGGTKGLPDRGSHIQVSSGGLLVVLFDTFGDFTQSIQTGIA